MSSYRTWISLFICTLFFILVNLHRAPRHLIYYNGGTFKCVAGFGVPCTEDSSVVMGFNIQGNWALPDENATIFKRDLRNFENSTSSLIEFDSSKIKALHSMGGRPALYETLARILEGKQCLAQLICKVASGDISLDNLGLIGELFYATLTPGFNSDSQELLPQIYWKAYFNGRRNSCKYSNECQVLNKFLNIYSILY